MLVAIAGAVYQNYGTVLDLWNLVDFDQSVYRYIAEIYSDAIGESIDDFDLAITERGEDALRNILLVNLRSARLAWAREASRITGPGVNKITKVVRAPSLMKEAYYANVHVAECALLEAYYWRGIDEKRLALKSAELAGAHYSPWALWAWREHLTDGGEAEQIAKIIKKAKKEVDRL